jgi:hypothetical protein
MGLKSRVSKLEAVAGGGDGICTCTPPFLARGANFYGDGYPPTDPLCPRCGLLPFAVLRRDPNFFGNANRLEELMR